MPALEIPWHVVVGAGDCVGRGRHQPPPLLPGQLARLSKLSSQPSRPTESGDRQTDWVAAWPGPTLSCPGARAGLSRPTIESINRGSFNHMVDVCMRLDGI
jgi:hypothetical protein